MKAIILCAGFGTRLYPYTQNKPKALLCVKGKTLLDLLVDNINQIDEIDEIVIVSNKKFFGDFFDYKKVLDTDKKVTVLNDGVMDNEHRLGAVRDLKFAMDRMGWGNKHELMVLAGDNWFDFSLKDFFNFYVEHGRNSTVFGQTKKDPKILRAGAVAILDKNGLVKDLEEKPLEPKSDFAVGPFYIYNKSSAGAVGLFLADKSNSADAPGSYPAWLVKHYCSPSSSHPLYAWDIKDKHFLDIGTREAFENVDEIIDNFNRPEISLSK